MWEHVNNFTISSGIIVCMWKIRWEFTVVSDNSSLTEVRKLWNQRFSFSAVSRVLWSISKYPVESVWLRRTTQFFSPVKQTGTRVLLVCVCDGFEVSLTPLSSVSTLDQEKHQKMKIFLSFCIKKGSAPLLNINVFHYQSIKTQILTELNIYYLCNWQSVF